MSDPTRFDQLSDNELVMLLSAFTCGKGKATKREALKVLRKLNAELLRCARARRLRIKRCERPDAAAELLAFDAKGDDRAHEQTTNEKADRG